MNKLVVCIRCSKPFTATLKPNLPRAIQYSSTCDECAENIALSFYRDSTPPELEAYIRKLWREVRGEKKGK